MRVYLGPDLNSRQQGDVGVLVASLWFAQQGHTVSAPISEACRYDLVVDIDGTLKRLQVKTCNYERGPNSYEVTLATSGGNQSWSKVISKLSANEVDLVFILTRDGRTWLVPIEKIAGQGKVVITAPKWAEFEVE